MCVKVSDLQSCSPRTCYQMWTPRHARRRWWRWKAISGRQQSAVAINWMQPIDKITARLKQCERGHRKIGPWLLCCKLLHLFNIPHGFLPLILSPGIENLILSFPSPQKVFIFFIYFLKYVPHFEAYIFFSPGVGCELLSSLRKTISWWQRGGNSSYRQPTWSKLGLNLHLENSYI